MTAWDDPRIVDDDRVDDTNPTVMRVAESLHANESYHLHDLGDGPVCVYCALRATRAYQDMGEPTPTPDPVVEAARYLVTALRAQWNLHPGSASPIALMGLSELERALPDPTFLYFGSGELRVRLTATFGNRWAWKVLRVRDGVPSTIERVGTADTREEAQHHAMAAAQSLSPPPGE